MAKTKCLAVILSIISLLLSACSANGESGGTDIGANDSVQNQTSDVQTADSQASNPQLKRSLENPEISEQRFDIFPAAPFELAEYVPYEECELADVEVSTMALENREKCAEKVLFDSKDAGGYKVHLLGKTVHTNSVKNSDPDAVLMFSVHLGISKDGKELDMDGTHTSSVSSGMGEYTLYKSRLREYVRVFEMTEYPLIVFGYIDENGQNEVTFFTIKKDKLYFLMGDMTAVGDLSEIGGQDVFMLGSMNTILSDDLTTVPENNALIDNKMGIIYNFDFDSVSDEFTKPHYIADKTVIQ